MSSVHICRSSSGAVVSRASRWRGDTHPTTGLPGKRSPCLWSAHLYGVDTPPGQFPATELASLEAQEGQPAHAHSGLSMLAGGQARETLRM